jgi:hypothetical protein
VCLCYLITNIVTHRAVHDHTRPQQGTSRGLQTVLGYRSNEHCKEILTLPVYLSVCLPVSLSVCLSICLSVSVSVCLSVCRALEKLAHETKQLFSQDSGPGSPYSVSTEFPCAVNFSVSKMEPADYSETFVTLLPDCTMSLACTHHSLYSSYFCCSRCCLFIYKASELWE